MILILYGINALNLKQMKNLQGENRKSSHKRLFIEIRCNEEKEKETQTEI